MPGKRNQRTKSTRARRGSSIAKADAFAKALRVDYANQFGEIANSVAWFYEENKDLRASKLGGPLNRRIVEAHEKARVLFGEFVARLYVVRGATKWVCRAAKKAWPLFNEKCSGFVAPGDLANWQELALTDAQHQTGKQKGHRSRASHFQHGEDFSWVEAAEGKRILLTQRQSAVVRMLAEAGPTFELRHAAILTRLDTPKSRLRDTFKHNPLWGTLIVSNPKKRTARLIRPPA